MKNEIKSDERNSNFEILRIIAMILIVGHHFAYHGGFSFEASTVTINELWVQFLMLGGKVGSNIYILITGYYLINFKSSRLKSIIKIWLECFFYSVCVILVLFLLGIEKFSVKDIATAFFPIIFEQWWFASSYVFLMILLPFINIFLNSLEIKEYQRLLAVQIVLWSIIPTFTGQFLQSNNLIWFISLYSIGGYCSKYDILKNWTAKKCLLLTIVLYIGTFMSAVIFDFIGTKVNFFHEKALHFYDMQSLTVVLISVFAILCASKMNKFSLRWINIVSSSTFGIYLIHDNRFLRKIIWDNIFGVSSYQDSIVLIPYSIAVIIIIFSSCSIIDLCRNKLFNITSILLQRNRRN